MKKQEVWVVTPWNEMAFSRVFQDMNDAEAWFRELYEQYKTPYSASVETCLDNGYFMGYRYNKQPETMPMAMYTINSFKVE